MNVGQAVSGMNHDALQWNPKAGQWFCLGCFQTSKPLSQDEAERELQQFQCDTGEFPSRRLFNHSSRTDFAVLIGRFSARGSHRRTPHQATLLSAIISESLRSVLRASSSARCSAGCGRVRLSSMRSKIALRAVIIRSRSLLASVSNKAAS
jgi:hypothetical protein